MLLGTLNIVNAAEQFQADTEDQKVIASKEEIAEIRLYQPEDKEFIKQQFAKNSKMLIPTTPDYDVDYLLDTNTPHILYKEHSGKVITKVLCYKKQQVGFGSCYMHTDTRGDILFVAIDKKFRGKKLAEIIVKTHMEDLKKLGAKRVELWVVNTNTAAHKLYTRLGFKKSEKNEICTRLFINT